MQGGMKGPMADMMKAMMGGQDLPDMDEMQSEFELIISTYRQIMT